VFGCGAISRSSLSSFSLLSLLLRIASVTIRFAFFLLLIARKNAPVSRACVASLCSLHGIDMRHDSLVFHGVCVCRYCYRALFRFRTLLLTNATREVETGYPFLPAHSLSRSTMFFYSFFSLLALTARGKFFRVSLKSERKRGGKYGKNLPHGNFLPPLLREREKWLANDKRWMSAARTRLG
jgi:hypothetical protein